MSDHLTTSLEASPNGHPGAQIAAHAVWLNRVYGSVRCSDAEARAIAARCVAAEVRGEITSVWHESAQHFGYQHRCNCVPCTKALAS